ASELESNNLNLDGVIHSAGIETKQSIIDSTWGDFKHVLSANIEGTDSINAVFNHCEWICYFTSSSAIIGDLGSCSYSIGKRYQMAVSQQKAQTPHPRYIAINWPLWKEGGMLVNDQAATEIYLKTSGQ